MTNEQTNVFKLENIPELKEKFGGTELSKGNLSGGGGDSLEPRVARLEGLMESVMTDLSEIRPDLKNARERLGKLEVKVDHLPSKGFIISTTMAAFALFTAVFLFQNQLGELFGNSPALTIEDIRKELRSNG